MRTKVLSANQRVVIGVLESAFPASDLRTFARVLKKVGLTLEIEQRGNDLVMFASRRVVTNDISVPDVKPIAKAGAA
jgi:hypothetical protein